MRVAVVGAGLMGSGIAQAASQHGMTAALYDITDEALDAARTRIRASVERLDKAGKIAVSVDEVVAAIDCGTDLAEAVAGADVVVEAAPELLDLKLDLFRRLDELSPRDALLGTNTSQFSITRLAAATKRPESVVGLHFFNPPPVMPLVEVIPGLLTTDETLRRALDFCAALGKSSTVAKDVQGFVASRGNLAFALECYRMAEEGVASPEDIDATFRLGFGHPMGPLELADYVGIDTILNVTDAMFEAYGERFRPPLALKRLVDANHTGRKTGRGFYDYSDGDRDLRG